MLVCRELVNLADIENIYKNRRHDKEARLESVMVSTKHLLFLLRKYKNGVTDRIIYLQRGREDREKFGYKDGRQNPFCSKTNRERQKKKNFMMIKHKMKAKVKRSFKDKQVLAFFD